MKSPVESSRESSAGALAVAGIIAWVWGMATVVGALMLMGGGVVATGGRTPVTRAVFQAINASTLTGFTGTVGIADFTRYGQTVCLALSVVGTLCAMIIGGMAVRRIAGIKSGDGSVVTGSFALLAAASVVALLTKDSVAALGAIGNSGLRTTTVRDAGSPVWFGVLLPLAMAGGLGVAVLLDVRDRLMGRVEKLSAFTWDSLVGVAGVFVAVSGLIWVVNGMGSDVTSLASAAGRAGSWMGYGVSLAPPLEVTRAKEMMLVWVPVVGVAIGGTAGGVGAGVMMQILRGVGGVGRGVGMSVVGVVGVGILVALAAVIGVVWVVLLSTEPQLGAERLLLLAVGAVTNTGISGGGTGGEPVSVVGPGLWAVSAGMVVGRVVVMVGVWAMVVGSRGVPVLSASAEKVPVPSAGV